MTAEDWPPFPSVTLGAGQWRTVYAALRRTGTKRDAAVAERIIKQIETHPATIRNNFQRRGYL